MESRAKLLGHSIHPILIVFPMGLLFTAVIFDIVSFVTDDPVFGTIAFWNIAAGLVGGLIAAVFGTIDWLAVPGDTRAKRIGIWHALANAGVIVLFAASWFMRLNAPDNQPGTAAFVLALAGAAFAGAGGWLGGELHERLAVGIHPGAHINAPSSLSGKPAAESRAEPQYLEQREVGR